MKKTTNNIMELVFILDRSGSMGGLESDTIGGFNSMIGKQKKEDGKCLVTTVLFDHEAEVLHDRIPLEEVPEMTEKDYSVRGSTALLDAMGETITKIADIHRYIRPEDVPSHTMFVITTDGMENSSRKFSSGKVKKLVKQKEKDGWEFLFIGANIDAVETASSIGISKDNAVDYMADSKGTGVVYEAVCAAVSGMRSKGAVGKTWKCSIEEDTAGRG